MVTGNFTYHVGGQVLLLVAYFNLSLMTERVTVLISGKLRKNGVIF